MAYQFTEKVSHKNEELAYILYMIIGSYYHRTLCLSDYLETRLSLYYHDMKPKKQEDQEAKVIAFFEHHIGKPRLALLKELDCEVSITRTVDGYALRFYTGFEEVTATVYGKGSMEVVLTA